jgi:putative transposase
MNISISWLKREFEKTRSYYIESVGHISEETIKRYIEEQKNR